jgi:hypothetical protein
MPVLFEETIGAHKIEFIKGSLSGATHEFHVTENGELKWVLPVTISGKNAQLQDLEEYEKQNPKNKVRELKLLVSFAEKSFERTGIEHVSGNTHRAIARALVKRNWRAENLRAKQTKVTKIIQRRRI